MAYLVGEKLMFLHIPKTAGTWVVNALPKAGVPLVGEIGLTHDVVAKQKGRSSFTFVRHPANWVKSLWMQYFLHGTGITNSPVMEIAPFYSRHESFDEFIGKILEKRPTIISEVFEKYIKPCQFVARTEDLPEALINILEKCQVEHKPKVINNWHRENVTDHALRERTRYAKGQREALLQAEGKFCTTWGYR